MKRKKFFSWNLHHAFRIRRNHKDVLFVRLFQNKKDLLSLYNALNGSDYTDENQLYINTLDDLIYISVKNDVSFIIGNHINLYEHQSSFCPNMPVRGLIYLARLYKAYIDMNRLNIYGTKLISLPKPQYVIFYNGTEEHGDITELRLSDAFGGDDSCLELKATMYNINFGHNKKLMEQCKVLADYAYFISRIRYYNTEKSYYIEKAVDTACMECIKKDILKNFLLKNRSEVMDMFMVDYHPSLLRKMDREDGYEDGFADGKSVGFADGKSVGFADGKSVGFADGKSVGFADGKSVGFADGKSVGFADGKTAGFAEGESVGFSRGEMENKKQIVKNMIAHGMKDKEIISLTECSQELIEELRK